MAQKKLIGQRCPICRKVYVPARGCCPTDGVAIGECWLYDEAGPIGTATVTALGQRQMMGKPPP